MLLVQYSLTDAISKFLNVALPGGSATVSCFEYRRKT